MAAALLAAAALPAAAALWPASAGASTPASACSGITVMVDFGTLPGGVQVACVTGAVTSGFDALQQAGFGWTGTQRFPGLICRIDGQPVDDPCVSAPSADRYWSYWTAASPGAAWVYSDQGAGTRVPPAGSVEGWAFADGCERTPGSGPCPSATTTSTRPPVTTPTTTATTAPTSRATAPVTTAATGGAAAEPATTPTSAAIDSTGSESRSTVDRASDVDRSGRGASAAAPIDGALVRADRPPGRDAGSPAGAAAAAAAVTAVSALAVRRARRRRAGADG